MYDFNQSPNLLLDSIANIFETLEGKKMEDDSIRLCRTEIDCLKDFYNCNYQQAIMIGLLIQLHFNNDQTSVKEIISHLGLKLSASININKLLEQFVNKDWIYPLQDTSLNPMTKYSLKSDFIRSITKMSLPSTKPASIKNSLQLLNQFNNKLKERKARSLPYDKLIEWTYKLLSNNEDIELSALILEHDLEPSDCAAFLHMCNQFYLGNNFIELNELLYDLNPPIDEQYKIRTSIMNGSSVFHKAELVKDVITDEIFSRAQIQLSEKAIHSFDKEIVLKKNIKQGLLNVVEPNMITAQQLYFEEEENKMVNKLHEMIGISNFEQLSEKLITLGMKPGISILLYGHPGTGKTETVMQLAKSSGRHLLITDASKLRSKWVGETEKNIKALFDEYRKSIENYNEIPILLFNEADAVFGKRRAVNDRGDQMENTLQNILLEELENFEGIFIATTNMEDNLDKAFDRRFLYKMQFAKPGIAAVEQIWKNKFPSACVDLLKSISKKGLLTGGQIENIRKKVAVDSLLDFSFEFNEPYLSTLINQELSLQNRLFTDRIPIGFIQRPINAH